MPHLPLPFPPPASPPTPVPSKSDITVTNGPFEYAMTNPTGRGGVSERPVCGFWIVKAKDLEEAVGWVQEGPLAGTFVEVREVFESKDMPGMSEEMRREEEGWRRRELAEG